MGVPSNVIVPFVGVEFSSARAVSGPAEMPVKVLLFGQKLASATAMTNGILYPVASASEVGSLAGYGSSLHRASIRYFQNNGVTDTYVMSVADAVAATASTQTVTITGTATGTGTVDLYIDGGKYSAVVAVGDSADTIGGRLADAINENSSAPVTAVNATGVVTLTCKTLGLSVGDFTTILNYYDSDKVPAGLSVIVGARVDGAGDPDVQDVVDAIGDVWFNVLTAPYSDATSLGIIEEYLENRAGVLEQKDGKYYTGKKDTRSNLITFATDTQRNCRYVSLVACTNQPHSVNEVVSAVASRSAESIQSDPAVPLHRMSLTGILPVPESNRWTLLERNQLAQNGIATLTQDNGVQTEATVTMYLRNEAGASSIAYQQQNTIFQLMRLRYRFVNRILTKYPRAKLANTADRIRSGQQVITPALGRAEAVAWFLEEELDGQVENVTQFKEEVSCVRDDSNPNRLNWILPPDLINQFIVGSADLEFILQGGE